MTIFKGGSDPTLDQIAKTIKEHFSGAPTNKKIHHELLTAYREASASPASELATATKAAPTLDITRTFNPAKACVLQTLIYVKGTVFGQKSPSTLHNLFFSNERYFEYQQYSDDAVSAKLFRDAGMTAVPFAQGTLMEDLPEQLQQGRYAVSMGGSAEDHVVILDVDGRQDGSWMDYDQLGGKGFKKASINRKAPVGGVFH